MLRNGAVRWIDEQRDAPALELTDVDIVLRNGLRSHDMRVDATPPAALGRPLLAARPHPPAAVLVRRRLAPLDRHALRRPAARRRRAARATSTCRSSCRAARARCGCGSTSRTTTGAPPPPTCSSTAWACAWPPTSQPLAIAHAGGRLTASRDPAGVSLAAEHFGFQTADGVAWPAGDVRLSWQELQRSVVVPPGPARLRQLHAREGAGRRPAATRWRRRRRPPRRPARCRGTTSSP